MQPARSLERHAYTMYGCLVAVCAGWSTIWAAGAPPTTAEVAVVPTAAAAAAVAAAVAAAASVAVATSAVVAMSAVLVVVVVVVVVVTMVMFWVTSDALGSRTAGARPPSRATLSTLRASSAATAVVVVVTVVVAVPPSEGPSSAAAALGMFPSNKSRHPSPEPIRSQISERSRNQLACGSKICHQKASAKHNPLLTIGGSNAAAMATPTIAFGEPPQIARTTANPDGIAITVPDTSDEADPRERIWTLSST